MAAPTNRKFPLALPFPTLSIRVETDSNECEQRLIEAHSHSPSFPQAASSARELPPPTPAGSKSPLTLLPLPQAQGPAGDWTRTDPRPRTRLVQPSPAAVVVPSLAEPPLSNPMLVTPHAPDPDLAQLQDAVRKLMSDEADATARTEELLALAVPDSQPHLKRMQALLGDEQQKLIGVSAPDAELVCFSKAVRQAESIKSTADFVKVAGTSITGVGSLVGFGVGASSGSPDATPYIVGAALACASLATCTLTRKAEAAVLRAKGLDPKLHTEKQLDIKTGSWRASIQEARLARDTVRAAFESAVLNTPTN